VAKNFDEQVEKF
jgi:DNA topoisomerase I